mmetsp:Transcript_4336/g.6235  ORF Transcript_4336/g.6235 Transcript_4336/m.6235 type:complete len:339 (+) Transcript_4336:99-1115(+)
MSVIKAFTTVALGSLLLVCHATAFVPSPRSARVKHYPVRRQLPLQPKHDHVTQIRGGGAALQNSLVSTVGGALKSGPWGVAALSGIASAVVVPLCMIRQGYSFSVGYGFSVFAMGLTVLRMFSIGVSISPLSLLAMAVMFYGARLGGFLLLREWTVPSRAEKVKEFDTSPRLARIPLALSVSIFYAFLTTPLLYAARASETNSVVMNVGVALAWAGVILEALADGQKYLVKKKRIGMEGTSEDTFVGPTNGCYRLCRHPNYFGEVLYWFGLLVGGIPSFGKSAIAWVCSALGFYGIYGVMTKAAERLDGKQKEAYEGQEEYDTYTKEVTASIWPWSSS